MTLILASSSPRRAELLRNAGLAFEVVPADVPEVHTPGENPTQYVFRLAQSKAETVAARHPGRLVLGADTVVVVGEQILEKPEDAEDAARMLRLLSGRTHQVITGVCLVVPGSNPDIRSEVTEVAFCQLSEGEIESYIGTGEPMGKAGAYGIQGVASRFIRGISGCYFNVVGLPVPLVYRMLQKHGVM